MNNWEISVRSPRVQLRVFRTIGRTTDGRRVLAERFTGIDRVLDLTGFLSDGGSITTTKSVREPAGAFSLTFVDQPHFQEDTGFETLYGILEPMDVVEIRMHGGERMPDTGIVPIVMRGFISSIQRTEAMGADGRPMRTVTITGQDYGKLWQILQIIHLPAYVLGQELLTQFRLFLRFGVGFQSALPPGEFVRQVIDKILNEFMSKMFPPASHVPQGLPIMVRPDVTVRRGVTSVTGPQNQEGTIYDLMRIYGDVGIWNELFIEDREDGVFGVYRVRPTLDIDGTLIAAEDGAVMPPVIPVDAEDVVSMQLSRTDAHVANFYWLRAPRYDMITPIVQKLWAISMEDRDTVNLKEHPNSLFELYGLRTMYGQTELIDDADPRLSALPGRPREEFDRQSRALERWIDNRRRIMVEQNKDNVLFESGTIKIKGNERIRAGNYIILRRGTFSSMYYVVAVQHDFAPFHSYFTTLTVERGTGFIERIRRKLGAGAPFSAERSSRPGGNNAPAT